MHPTLLLFDLDGTLVDSSAPLVDGILAVAADEGLPVPSRAWAAGRIGFPPEETWALLGAPDPAATLARFRARVLPGVPARSRAMPGARDALAELSGRATLAVVTTRTTDSALATLAALSLGAELAFVIGGDLVARPKPAPDVVLAALARADTPPNAALVIGDTTADVAAARAARVRCWSVLGGQGGADELRAAAPDRILGGLGELVAALDESFERPAPTPRPR